MKHSALLLPCLLALGSCATPPKPPGVDESRKRPVNSAAAVALQTCQSELQNTRIVADEKSRDAASTRAAFVKLAALRQAPAAAATPQDAWRSTIHTLLFDFGSAQIRPTGTPPDRWIGDALAAPLVLVRGRTDGAHDNPADSRIARQRAEAARAYLVAAGVAPERIRLTWQPVGDHAADNTLPGGRALNRRVEIEIYRLAPRFAAAADSTDS